MIKFELPELGLETVIEEYEIVKKREEISVLTTMDTKARFSDDAYDTLFEMSIQGLNEEPALVTVFCADTFEEMDAIIRHGEGDYLHKSCLADKKVQIVNPFECIKDKDINIFDYKSDTIQTVQGTLERDIYSAQGTFFVTNDLHAITLEEMLAAVGSYGDFSFRGWFPEYILLESKVEFEYVNEPDLGTYQLYTGHRITLFISLVRIINPVQLSESWLPLPPSEGTGFYFVGNPVEFGSPTFSVQGIAEIFGATREFIETRYEAGRWNTILDIGISNMIDFKEMIEDIFSCTDYPIVSNFFDINSDATQPENEEYSYAEAYLWDLKIMQSYDIIKEAAIQDSFGKSGKINVKKLLAELTRIFELMLTFDKTEEVIRWEHISYFQSKGINTITEDISYEMNDIIQVNRDNVNREYFRFAKATPTEGYYESIIDYQNYTISDRLNEKSEISELFITDYIGLINNATFQTPDFEKLFFLISTKDGAIIENNTGLRMQKLVGALKNTNRHLLFGLKDGVPTLFKEFSIGLTCDVSFLGSIKLFVDLMPFNSILLKNGLWQIEEISYKNSKMINLKIRK